MAIVRAQVSFNSSFSPSQFTYDVFLSFSGKDTRFSFTDHLYTALVGAGLSTFRDDDDIRRGENIKSELDGAITKSRSSIIIFSKNYASSSWCLDELVLILQQRISTGLIALPIFYDVDPTNIRRQTGSISVAFTRHEERFKDEADHSKREDWMNKVKGWRAALKEAADLSGMVLKNEADGYESKFIKKIVSFIENKVARNVIHVAPYLVGMHDRVENIDKWLKEESNDVRIAAICGMGGVGKTTIAKCVYNMNCNRFPYKSFLADIRENSKRPDGLLRLQRQLLSDINGGSTKEINSVIDGTMKTKVALSRGRVLIVLDDVDQITQVEAIFGMREWFCPGSRIIITTKNMQLLKSYEPCNVYAVKEMNPSESLELFSLHAFGDKQPDECYLHQSRRILRYCKGLPLALKVLGSSLRGKSIELWNSTMEKLKVSNPYANIQDILKISYESLEDGDDRDLLLDIACFFSGKRKSFVVDVMDECGYHTIVGIENLIDRCLLSIDKYDRLRLHHLVELMAKEIIRQQSPRELGKRSRLWYDEESLKVLKDKIGTETIEGLALNMNMIGEDKSPKRSFSTRNEREANLETNAFSRMHKLRLLQINHVQLIGEYKDFPKNLRWLSWHGFPLRSLPKEFPVDTLVAIDMQHSKLNQFWLGTKTLGLLKSLNLSHCHYLVKTPDFSKLPALENLMLENCVRIAKIDESIQMAQGLVYLNLRDCVSLKDLPRNIDMLKVLETLIISGCSNLKTLPSMIKMESLKVFHADGISLGHVSSTSGEKRTCFEYIRSWISPPKTFPQLQWSSLPQSLVSLSFVGCNLSDNDFPRNFGSASSLQFLDLSSNPISSFPGCFTSLKQIKNIYLKRCPKIEAITAVPSGEKFVVIGCPSLKEVTFQPSVSLDQWVCVEDCEKLVQLDKYFKLETVENIDREIINSLGIDELMESFESIRMKLRNYKTNATTKGPVQGVHELNIGGKIFSMFYPGSTVPSWFAFKGIGTCMSFKVLSPHTAKIRCLNICFVYKISRPRLVREGLFFMVVHNKTKKMKFAYHPSCLGIPDKQKGNRMIWLSRWKFGSHQLEDGDEVIISQLFSVQTTFQVKEMGAHVVFDDNNEQVKNDHPSQSIFFPEDRHLIGHDGSTQVYFVGSHLGINKDYVMNLFRDNVLEKEEFGTDDFESDEEEEPESDEEDEYEFEINCWEKLQKPSHLPILITILFIIVIIYMLMNTSLFFFFLITNLLR